MLTRRHFLLGCAAAAFVQVAAPHISLAGSFESQPAKDPLARRFGGPFSLTDQHGQRVTEKSWPGQFTLVYFGFTRCTDACPVDLPNLVQALDLLGASAGRIQPLFITVDPDDTPERMKAYVEAFHPRLIGLTGSESELAAVAKAYRVHRYKVELKSGAASGAQIRNALHTGDEASIHLAHGPQQHQPGQRYSIDHGTLTYLMGPDGGFRTLIPHASPPQRIAEVLQNYVIF